MDSGVTWANILDFSVDTTEDPPREQKLLNIAGNIMDQWNEHLAPHLTDVTDLTSVSWVDLNTADGSTGETTTGYEDAGPFNGDLAEAPLAANVSVLVRKVGVSARGQRSGRWYQVGYPEGNADWTSLTSAFRTTLQADFSGFLDALTEFVYADPFSSVPVVLHTTNQGTPTNPDIVATGWSEITAMDVQSRLATQRRRLRR